MTQPDNPLDGDAEKFVHELAEELESYLPEPRDHVDGPWLMPPEHLNRLLAEGPSAEELASDPSSN